MQVTEIPVGESTPVDKIESGLINAVFSNDVTDNNMGLLITKNYMFGQLSKISSNDWLFSLPWFTAVDEVVHDSSFHNHSFFSHENISLNYALSAGYVVRNKKLYHAVSQRISESELFSKSDSNYISSMLEPIYDSVIVATRIGSWLSNKKLKLNALSRRISWESSMWVGMSGLLRLRDTLERDFDSHLNIRLSRDQSGPVMRYPSGTWQVLSWTN